MSAPLTVPAERPEARIPPAVLEQLGRPIRGPSALGSDPRRLWSLTWALARTEFKLAYFGSALGYLWQLMRPLLLFGVIQAIHRQSASISSTSISRSTTIPPFFSITSTRLMIGPGGTFSATRAMAATGLETNRPIHHDNADTPMAMTRIPIIIRNIVSSRDI